MSSFSLGVRDVSQKMKGRRSLSMDQLLSLKSVAFSILKRVSMEAVACMSKEASLLCSDKNCCFLVIMRAPKVLTSAYSIHLSPKKARKKMKEVQPLSFKLRARCELYCGKLLGLVEFRVNGSFKARSFGFVVPVLLER